MVATTQAGNWSDSATWVGGVVPGSNNQATINHAVTVDVNTIIGDGSTTVDQLGVYAPLTVSDNITLTLQGRAYANESVYLGPGSVIAYDAAADARWYQSPSGDPHSALVLRGTPQNPAVIESVGPTGRMYITGDTSAPGYSRIDAENFILRNLGSETNNRAVVWSQKDFDNNYPWRLVNGVIDNCYGIGDIFTNSSDDWSTGHTGVVEIINCEWINSPEISPWPTGGNWGHLMAQGYHGTRVHIEGCKFDAGARIFFCKPSGVNFVNNVTSYGTMLVRRLGTANDWSEGILGEFSGNWVPFSGTGMGLFYGDTVKNNVFINMSGNNPHFHHVHGGFGKLTYHGNVLVSVDTGAAGEGDGLFPREAKSGVQADNYIDFDSNVILPNGNGFNGDSHSCTLWTGNYNSISNAHVETRHTTAYVGLYGLINVGENSTPVAGLCGKTRGNMCAGRPGGTTYKIYDLGGSVGVNDVFLAADVSNNGGHNLASGGQSPGGGYHTNFQFSGSSSVGNNDVDNVDPLFVDTTRVPWKWVDSTHDAITGVAAVEARLSSDTEDYSIFDLIDWLREGWRPQAEQFRGAGHADDGSRDLGAVPMAEALPAAPEYFDVPVTEFPNSAVPADVEEYIGRVDADVGITPNVLDDFDWTGPSGHSSLRLYFDAALSSAEQATVLSLAGDPPV